MGTVISKRISMAVEKTAMVFFAMLATAALVAGCTSSEAEASDVSQASSEYFSVENIDLDFTERDLDPSYDETQATSISLEKDNAKVEGDESSVEVNGTTVIIKQAGVFVLSGSWAGQIQVDCDGEDKAKVQLVLDGVDIQSTDGPAIYVKQAKKCFVTLKDGSKNTLTDSDSYTLESDSDEPYATLFSKDDLTIQGDGSLAISANYKHGIACKDELAITGGSYSIKAVEDAIRGTDCVKVCDGTYEINCGADGIKSSKNDDPAAGFVFIEGGEFTISSNDDGIHAETYLIIDSGEINIESCVEGLEGRQVFVNDGKLDITSSDDGINATSGSNSEGDKAPEGISQAANNDASDVFIKISGGQITIDAEGDGIDSNGSLEVSGGTTFVNGPSRDGNSAIDYEASGTISGGNIIAVGPAGMAQSFSGGSQAFAMANVSGKAGDKVSVEYSSGNNLGSMVAAKDFSNVVVSCPEFNDGETYVIRINDSATEIVASTTSASVGNPEMQGPQDPNMQGAQGPQLDTPNMQGGQGPQLDTPNMQGGQGPQLDTPNMQGGQGPQLDMPNMQGGQGPKPETPNGSGSEANSPQQPKPNAMHESLDSNESGFN